MSKLPTTIWGPAGIPGSKILTGSVLPSNTTGMPNDLFINNTTGNYYIKTLQGWKLQGHFVQILTNTGPPLYLIGGDGDLYIDTITGFYYIKSNGSWTLLGPQGSTNYWTESQILDPQAIWNPKASAFPDTDVDTTVEPLGTGSFRTASDGDERGEYAIDLQRFRASATQVATGQCSVLTGGSSNTVSGDFSVISGGENNNITGGSTDSAICGGNTNLATGNSIFVGGGNNNSVYSSNSAIVGGSGNIVEGYSAVIGGGINNNLNAYYSVICGGADNYITNAANSVISGGYNNTINGGSYSAIVGGYQITDSGNFTVAGGKGISLTDDYSVGFGSYNVAGSIGGFSRMFMIGNGLNSGSKSNLFSITSDGTVHTKTGGSYVSSGADYAEYFESNDTYKYPAGTSVIQTGSGRKIRIATQADTPFGVISENPSFVGNAAEEMWHLTYIPTKITQDTYQDVYETKQIKTQKETLTDGKLYIDTIVETINVPVTEEVDVVINGVPKGKKRIPKRIKTGSVTIIKHILNPLTDSSKVYVPRSARPEWNIVGLHGTMKVLKTSVKAPNWIKLSDVDEVYDLYLIK